MDTNYELLIKDMTWSHTRLTSFDDCKYQWYLRYILRPGKNKPALFFATYGIKMHELIAAFLKGEITRQQAAAQFIKEYNEIEYSYGPQNLLSPYFDSGIEYLKNMEMPKQKILEVEGKHKFNVDSVKMTGVIDLVLEDDNGDISIVDHKSTAMQPRSNRKKPTKGDEALDKKLRQLYLYSIPVFETYGKYPKKLCFNCFRKGGFIEEPFNEKSFEETKEWTKDTVDRISKEKTFRPEADYYYCRYLCSEHDFCEFWRD